MNIKRLFIIFCSFILMQDVFSQISAGLIGSSQSLCYNTMPEELHFIEQPEGWDTIYMYQWQASIDNMDFVNIENAAGVEYQPQYEEGTIYYRVLVVSGDEIAYTNSVAITCFPNIVPPVIGNSQAICYETEPQMLSISVPASGGDGSFTNRWQVRDGNEWIDISDNAGGGFQPPQLYETTDYRLTSESTYGCGSVYSNIITINVYEVLSSGAITDSQTICYNTEPSAFLFSTPPQGAGGEYTYQWQRSSDNVTFEDIPNANDAVYQSPSLSETTYFRCEVNSVACGVSARSDSILVSVRDEFVPGTISEDQIICYHSVPNFLSGTSCTGGDEPYQYQWEQSSDNGNTFSESAGTGSGTLLFSPDALEQTMVYRLRYTSASGCGTSYSNQLAVTVYPDIAPPVIGNSQTICYGTEPQMLSISVPASGGNGSFTNRWQVRDGNEWIDIPDNAGGGFQPPQLYETTDYRLTSESTYGCGSVYSNIITINVYEALLSGTITDSQTICYNTEPSAFSFSTLPQGAGGEYTYQWQRSSDNVTFEDIPNANDAVYQSPSLSETTYFRCEVNSIICETNDYAESIEIVVLPIVVAGVIGNDQEICYNTTPSPLVVTTNSYGGDGNFRYQWQTSTDGTSFEDISFENDTIYQPQTLTQTTWYRLKFINCDTVFSNVILVLVNPLPTEKNIEGPFLVCRNASDVTYVLAQDQENIEYQWQIEGGVFTNYSEMQTIVHWDDTGNDGVITLFQIDTTTRCWLTTDYYIAKREERSPDKTNIVKKNNSSNILICQDNTENSHYQWGFVNLESNEEQFIANSDYQYVLIPHTIDTFRFKYFVDIYYGVSDVCTTRTYYPSGSTITATTDLSCLRDVYAFPIPTKNHLYIRGNNLKGKYTASFKNYLGQTLLEKKFCSDYNNDVVQLDFNLPNGFYLLVLDNGKEYKTLKIIVE